MELETLCLDDACKVLGITQDTFLVNLKKDKIRPVVFCPQLDDYLYVSRDFVKFFYFSGEVFKEEITTPLYKKNGDEYQEVVSDNGVFWAQGKDVCFLMKDLTPSLSSNNKIDVPQITLDLVLFKSVTIDGTSYSLSNGQTEMVRYFYEKHQQGHEIISQEEYQIAHHAAGDYRLDQAFKKKEELFQKLFRKIGPGKYKLNFK